MFLHRASSRIDGSTSLAKRLGAALSALPLAVALACAMPLVQPGGHAALAQGLDPTPIRNRNLDVSREGANKQPRSEDDQARADGWPLYRSERGQAAFNDAMAALKATDSAAPTPKAFKGCIRLECRIVLPAIGADGWIPAGRIWVSPSEYVLIAHSPRHPDGEPYRRRTFGDMRVFVYHEFQSSSHNTDPFDTISSHKGSVFVPLYMSKQRADAKGRQFVIVVQVAPYDVVSVHAVNHGSAGPGMEVAKNTGEELDPLQGLAGIVIGTIIKTAAPHLHVVNHRNVEGLPMLQAYEHRLDILRRQPDAVAITLPFVPALPQRVASATARLGSLVRDPNGSLNDAVAAEQPEPMLIGPVRLAVRPECGTPAAAKLGFNCRPVLGAR